MYNDFYCECVCVWERECIGRYLDVYCLILVCESYGCWSWYPESTQHGHFCVLVWQGHSLYSTIWRKKMRADNLCLFYKMNTITRFRRGLYTFAVGVTWHFLSCHHNFLFSTYQRRHLDRSPACPYPNPPTPCSPSDMAHFSKLRFRVLLEGHTSASLQIKRASVTFFHTEKIMALFQNVHLSLAFSFSLSHTHSLSLSHTLTLSHTRMYNCWCTD